MKKLILGLGVAIAVAGCNRDERTPDADRRDVNIRAPDVQIKVKKDKGVEVTAPDAKVKVQP